MERSYEHNGQQTFLTCERTIGTNSFKFARAHEPILSMVRQKSHKAMPSVAASLIERLPNEGDPERSREETIARNVTFAAYAGMLCT